MKKLLIVLCFIGALPNIYGQQKTDRKYPVVGETIPDYLFKDVVNSSGKSMKISDFRGKWLLIDFWGLGCTACIKSFPKMDSLSCKFQNEMQLIMVAYTARIRKKEEQEYHERTKDFYKKLEKKLDLQMTVAFDSIFPEKMDIASIPHIYIIDENGVLRYKTQSVDDGQLSELFSGGKPQFMRAYSGSEPRDNKSYDQTLPLLTNGNDANGGSDTSYLFRSLLTEYQSGMSGYATVDLNEDKPKGVIKNGRLEIFRVKANDLYMTAYFGASHISVMEENPFNKDKYPKVVWNVSDSEALEKVYSYSLTVPKKRSSREYLLKVMQSDLANYFGYTATIETRKMPVVFLEIDDLEKVKNLVSQAKRDTTSKSKKTTTEGIQLRNYPMAIFSRSLYYKYLNKNRLPFVDATGILDNISINFKANLADPDDIRNSLKLYGLRIVEREKEMKVLVVSDTVSSIARSKN